LLIFKGSSIFTKVEIFNIAVFASNFIRDFVVLIIVIGMNIILAIILKKQAEKRRLLTNTKSLRDNKTNTKNGIIAMIMCSLSIINNSFTYSVSYF